MLSVIAKKIDPESKGELRNLSLSLFVSKVVENVICDLLMKCWGHKIDGSQFGGRKGYSVTLYLIKLEDFILSNLEKSVLYLKVPLKFFSSITTNSVNVYSKKLHTSIHVST